MDIATLIRATKGDRSYEQLSEACGGEPTAGRLQQIATKPLKEFPEPRTIRSLARGLGVGERRVVLAWAETLGLDVERAEPRLVQLLPPAAASLDDEQTAAVLAVIRAMVRPLEADIPTVEAPTPPDTSASSASPAPKRPPRRRGR